MPESSGVNSEYGCLQSFLGGLWGIELDDEILEA